MKDNIHDTPPLAELLLDEFMHRINNELAALIAIVSRVQAINRDEATGRALERVQTRLLNVGRVQHALHGPRGDTDVDASEYLRQLCESRRSTLENTAVYFVGRSVSIDAARCRRLGMIVCELVENARKHAFSSTHGPIPFSISVELGVLDGKIQCRVADNGRGCSGAPWGRGLTIVRALANTLNGSISQEPATAGTAWLLTMPHWSPTP